MNKLLITFLLLGWTGVTALAAASLATPSVSSSAKRTGSSVAVVSSSTDEQTPVLANVTTAMVNGQAAILTMDEVGAHHTATDCWLVIAGTVYDVTDAISSHPGGSGPIVNYCGQDATTAFSTKDKVPGSDHSTAAWQMLAGYEIGALGGRVPIGTQTAVAEQTQLANTTRVVQAASRAAVSQHPSTDQTAPITLPASNLSVSTAGTAVVLSAAAVAAHHTPGDCWVIMEGNVYDVTTYLSSHPGGAAAIINYCGADLTTAFNQQGHSASARALFGQFFVGQLGTTVSTTSSVPTAVTQSNNQTPGGQSQRSYGYEDEYEDEYEVD